MNIKRKQLYAGILIVAAGALLVDRVLFPVTPGPATAGAAMARSLAALGVESASGPITSVQAAPFPSALPMPVSIEQTRDLFAAGETILRVIKGESGAGVAGSQRGGADYLATAPFDQRHQLSGVIVGPDGAYAVIDGQWLRSGEKIDDCTLTVIGGTSVTFDCPSGEQTLSVVEKDKNGHAGDG